MAAHPLRRRNEGIAWLLDPRIVAAIADSGLLPESEAPALATGRC